MCYCYILYSETKGKYYIGQTCDELSDRIRRHNTNHKGFTGGTGDWVLKYSETFETKEMALKREKEIKGWKSSKRIAQLVQSIPHL